MTEQPTEEHAERNGKCSEHQPIVSQTQVDTPLPVPSERIVVIARPQATHDQEMNRWDYVEHGASAVEVKQREINKCVMSGISIGTEA